MKISIIGMGKVGSTLAFALSLRDFAKDLVLVGRSPEAALGDALDIEHAQSFVDVPTRIASGAVEDTNGSDLIAFCASVPMGANVVRAELGPGNVRILQDLLPQLAARSPDAVLLVVSNPVDVLTWFAREISGFPAERVIGTGTLIDSARFRRMLSAELGIHSDDLRAYILGEHGPTQFAAMSSATAGGERISDTPERREIFRRAAGAGIEVFRHKGYTNYAVAMAAVEIIEAIALDKKHTLPVSTRLDGYLGVDDVCLSLPCVVGRAGIERVLHPQLSEQETSAFLACAASVRDQIAVCSP